MHLEAWLQHLSDQVDGLSAELEQLRQERGRLQDEQNEWQARIPTLPLEVPSTASEIQEYLRYPDKISREICRLKEQESQNQTRIDRCRSNIVEIRRNMKAIDTLLARREELARREKIRREERMLTEMVGATARWWGKG